MPIRAVAAPMDLSFYTSRATLIGGTLFGLLLFSCPIVGRFKNDPSYYKLFLICAPLYVAYMLLYPLPREAVTLLNIQTGLELEFFDDFFGPTRGIILAFITAPVFIVATTYYFWMKVKRAHDGCYRRPPTRHRRPLIREPQRYEDENPYESISEGNYT